MAKVVKMRLNPQRQEELFCEALDFESIEDLEGAKRLYRACGDYPKALVNLGRLLSLNSSTHEAAGLFKKAIELEPLYALAYYNLGSVLHELDPEAAMDNYLKAVKIDSYNADVYYNMGVLIRSYMPNLYHKGIFYLSKFIRLKPHDDVWKDSAMRDIEYMASALKRKKPFLITR